jgi:hypothetical protein
MVTHEPTTSADPTLTHDKGWGIAGAKRTSCATATRRKQPVSGHRMTNASTLHSAESRGTEMTGASCQHSIARMKHAATPIASTRETAYWPMNDRRERDT